MQGTLRCTTIPPFLHIGKGLAWRKRVLHLFCIGFQVRCTQFKKMFIFLCNLWRNVKVKLTSQLPTDFHQYHKKVSPSLPCYTSLLDVQKSTNSPWAVLQSVFLNPAPSAMPALLALCHAWLAAWCLKAHSGFGVCIHTLKSPEKVREEKGWMLCEMFKPSHIKRLPKPFPRKMMHPGV